MAHTLLEKLALDEVRFIPSAHHPHKPLPQVSSHNRSDMVKLAILNNPQFKVDDRELKRAGASYTIDTLESLREELGSEVRLVLMMGSDVFAQLNTWHRWQEIINFCHIALVRRLDFGASALLANPLKSPQKLHTQQEPHPTKELNLTKELKLPTELQLFLEHHYTPRAEYLREKPAGLVITHSMAPLEISSTAIRQALKNQHSVRDLLPESVLDYIDKHQLYRMTNA